MGGKPIRHDIMGKPCRGGGELLRFRGRLPGGKLSRHVGKPCRDGGERLRFRGRLHQPGRKAQSACRRAMSGRGRALAVPEEAPPARAESSVGM